MDDLTSSTGTPDYSMPSASPVSPEPDCGSPQGDEALNGKAAAGLVLGILGLIFWLLPILGLPVTIIGLLMSIKGLKSAKRGMAVAAMILSILGLTASVINAGIGAYLGVTGRHPLLNRTHRPAVTAGQLPGKLEAGIYTSSLGFSFRPPQGWNPEESGQGGTLVVFRNPQIDQDGGQQFYANLNVVSEPTGADLNGYLRAALKAYPRVIPSYQNLEQRDAVTESGEPVKIISGRFEQNGYQIKNIQLITVKGGQAWIVTGTSLEPLWDKYRDTFEKALLSFKKD